MVKVGVKVKARAMEEDMAMIGIMDCFIVVPLHLHVSRYMHINSSCRIGVLNKSFANILPLAFYIFSQIPGIFGMCLPCCQLYNTANRMGESGYLYTLMPFVIPCIPMMLLHGKMRLQYAIGGSPEIDIIAAFCCTQCVSCQMSGELDRKGV